MGGYKISPPGILMITDGGCILNKQYYWYGFIRWYLWEENKKKKRKPEEANHDNSQTSFRGIESVYIERTL